MGPYLISSSFGARRALADRGELVVRVSFYVIILVVLFALWKAAIGDSAGQVAGYSFGAIAWYLAAAEGSVIATKPRLIETIGNDIGGGAVATEMLRPASVLVVRVWAEIGEALARLAWAAFAGVAFVLLSVGQPPDIPALLLAVPAATVAVACNVVAQHLFAAISFWLNDAKATWFLYQKLVFLVGGMLLPLQMLPAWLQQLAWVLPFWTMAYAPGRLASGHLEPWLIAGQVAWLAVLAGCAATVFAAGERRLQVGGG
jgi:ABC-2 type transport system permease protein